MENPSFLNLAQPEGGPIPIVLWHGMGDTCCDDLMLHVTEKLKKQLPGVYVHSLMIGNNENQDLKNGHLMNVNHQIEFACELIKNDPCLHKNGYHAIGFSQGAQFLRAVAQKCPQGSEETDHLN